MTADEWDRACMMANRWDAKLVRQKAFNEPETPLDGLILFRESREYVLLNRSGKRVRDLTYATIAHDDLKRRLGQPARYRVEGFDAATYVRLQAADPRPQRDTAFVLTHVEWEDGTSWRGQRRLEAATPISVGTRLDRLDLEKSEAGPIHLRTPS